MSKIHFFLDEFHHGAVNHILHFVGFTLFGYGLGIENWWVVILAPFVMEAGHLYNYSTGRDKHHAIRIIPMQIGAGLIFAGIVYLVVRMFSQ